MTREITTTTVRSAQMTVKDGVPEAVELPDKSYVGNFSLEKAQRYIDKEYDNATVIEVLPRTEIYEMAVEDFMRLGKLREIKQK